MLPQFDISTFSSQFFWFIVCFSISLIGVFRFLIPAYRKILDKRIDVLKKDVEAIVYLQREIMKLKQERLEKIEKAKDSNEQSIKDGIKSIVSNYENLLKKAQQEHENSIKDLEQSMNNQKNLILSNIQPFINECVDEIMKKFAEEHKKNEF